MRPTDLLETWHPLQEWFASPFRVAAAKPNPDEQTKLEAIALLSREDIATADVSRLVLDEVKGQCERKRAADRTLEMKAASIVGFAAVVLGFATTFDNSVLLKMTWGGSFYSVIPALVLESLAILVGVIVMSTHTYGLPDAIVYNHPQAIEDRQNEARIAMALAQRWGHCERELDASNATRSARLTVALWLFALGLFYTIAIASLNVTGGQGG